MCRIKKVTVLLPMVTKGWNGYMLVRFDLWHVKLGWTVCTCEICLLDKTCSLVVLVKS